MVKHVSSLALLLGGGFALTTYAAGPTFRPDFLFKGSALTGWTPLGQADWRAQNGEIIGTPRSPEGGWLVLNKSFQDVAVFSNVTCNAGCKAGVLLRAEKTPDGGMKGVYVSISEGDLASYAVTIDAQGKQLTREPLPTGRGGGGGGGRGAGAPGAAAGGRGAGAPAAAAAPPADAPPAAGAAPPPGGAPPGRGGGAADGGPAAGGGAPRGGGAPGLPPGMNLPGLARPNGAYKPGQMNNTDITIAKSAVTLRLNGGSLGAAAGNAAEAVGKFGPIALYVGGTAPASFKDVAYADLNARPYEDDKVGTNFRMRRLSEFYYGYSAAIADIDKDGNQDVISGPIIYYGPSFNVGREYYAGVTYNPTSEWPLMSMVNLAYDWTGDGWIDLLNMSGNAGVGTGTLSINPRGENRRWDQAVVMAPPAGTIGNEETLLRDIDGDGKPELIHSGQNTLRYSKADPANPTGPWIVKTISEPGPWGVNIGHGMGIGDINADGRMDYVTTYGWWEQPPAGNAGLWTHHPEEFGRWGASQGGAGGAEIGIYDVNGDRLNDIVTAMEGHGFGLAWYEQKKDAAGTITFVRHVIMDSALDTNAGGVFFTQPHAVAFADMDRDGLMDMIVGKRHHSHFQYADPDNWSLPVLYWYRTVRNARAPGGAEFVPNLISNRSGVGSHIGLGDLNKDGTTDVAVSGASGTFVFFNNIPRR